MSSVEPLGTTAVPTDLLGEYLQNLGHIDLLTAEEEVTLARCIEIGVLARERLEADAATDDARLLRQLISDGERAHERFIRANLRLVVSVAKRHAGLGLPLMDLIQEGNIGLDRAVRKFDFTKGFKFSTYAIWWIRQSITRAIAESSRLIRMPTRIAEGVSTMRRRFRDLEGMLGRSPTIEELAIASGRSVDKVQQLLELDRQPVSLNAPLGDDNAVQLGDLLEDEQHAEILDIVNGTIRAQILHECMTALPARDAAVLRRRYGFHDDTIWTLQELAHEFGISRERVRQIEQRGLRALRARQHRERLRN